MATIHGRVFDLIQRHSFFFNACWEDPRSDRVALELGPDDTMLVITSAGCNVLDYLLDEPRHVHAVDVNPRQTALLELKLAAVRELDFEPFFAMFGRGRLPDVHDVYRQRLRPALSAASRSWWDGRIGCFSGRGWRPSFYFHGATGLLARLANGYVDRLECGREAVDSLLAAATVDRQREIFERHMRPRLEGRVFRWCLARDTTLALMGVPRAQWQQIARRHPGGIGQFIVDCLEAVFARLPLTDNYFWRVYMTGEYTRECCPEYLKADNFARLKAGLIDRVTLHTASVHEFLRAHRGPLTRLVLLDHMDWLAGADPRQLAEQWQTLLDRAAPATRVLWRSAGLDSAFVDRIEVVRDGRTRRVGDLLTYHRELAARLHAIDRPHTYSSFCIADLPPA